MNLGVHLILELNLDPYVKSSITLVCRFFVLIELIAIFSYKRLIFLLFYIISHLRVIKDCCFYFF